MRADTPRFAIVAAHPDDEVIGAGGQMREMREPVVVHVTDGAPRDLLDAVAKGFRSREEYAAARRRELLAALALAGVAAGQTRSLGVADQEASLDLTGLALRIGAVLRECEPDIVLCHPYEGGHPDHDATAFAVHAACRLLERDGLSAPALREFTSYHMCAGRMITGGFVPYYGCAVTTVVLSEEARQRKRQMLECYATQRETLRPFRAGVERFRRAPRYDFRLPPHREIYYDLFPWGINSETWLRQARRALEALGLDGTI